MRGLCIVDKPLSSLILEVNGACAVRCREDTGSLMRMYNT